ncbi:Barwin-like endoglucanase [Mycena sanguinolenta]|uniref:Barwin-like endoglucanase n=1 Tax=Mycena sanguinolenta TaxID=230812 RepID=A0A8H6YRJ2_9AGAR|nr:Barwin-like endoglucanase [Mycena sanguinolenta]
MFSFAVLALAAASAGAHSISHVRRHHVPRTQPQQPPAGWATGYLEPYDTYHERYLEIGCENKHNTPFFDSCCHPLLSTETVAKNRPACCAVNATVACPGAAAPAKTSVAAPAKTSPAAAPAKTSVAAPANKVLPPAKSSPAAAPAKSSPAAAPAKTSAAAAPAKTTAAPAEGDDEDCDDDDGDDDNTGDDEDCDCDDEGDDGDDDDDDDDCEDEGDGSDEPPASPATTKKVASSTEATPSATPTTTQTAAPKPTSTSTKAAPKPTTTSTTAQHTTTSPTSAPAPTGDKSTAPTYTTGGVGTWYMQDNEAGACGHWHSDSDFVVALETKTYDHGINCGRGIQICDLDNNKVIGHLTNERDTSVDMSRGMFEALAALAVGEFKIKWTFTTS